MICPRPPMLLFVSLALWLPHLRGSLAEIPNCPFGDTVRLPPRSSNGTYVYDGIAVPDNLTATYDYFELANGTRRAVREHVRGCVCQLKVCLRYCCHPHRFDYTGLDLCANESEASPAYDPYVEVAQRPGGVTRRIHVRQEFVYQVGVPCYEYQYVLNPQASSENAWHLLENGSIFRLWDSKILSRSDYCLTLTNHSSDSGFVLNPLVCGSDYTPEVNDILNKIAMSISVCFFVATIIVYAAIPELRNLHGKCLICYLTTLASGYTLLVLIEINFMTNEACSFLGFLAYFCFIAAFAWVNVISFDLWHNFRNTKSSMDRRKHNRRFLWYSLYAWSLAIGSTLIVIYCQYWAGLDPKHQPGIGMYTCYLKADGWTMAYYLYSLLFLLMIVNVLFFAHTAIKINRVKKEFNQFSRTERSARHLKSQSDNFWLYLRLLMVMGIIWLLEVFSYLTDEEKSLTIVRYILDFANAIQGVIIFVLFVCKRKVLSLIRKKIDPNETSKNTSSTRCKTSMLASSRNLSQPTASVANTQI